MTYSQEKFEAGEYSPTSLYGRLGGLEIELKEYTGWTSEYRYHTLPVLIEALRSVKAGIEEVFNETWGIASEKKMAIKKRILEGGCDG